MQCERNRAMQWIYYLVNVVSNLHDPQLGFMIVLVLSFVLKTKKAQKHISECENE